MRRDIGIKPVRPDARSQALNLPQLGQQGKIPVNGSQTDIWKFFSNIGVNHISRRMIVCCHEPHLYGFSLSAVFSCRHPCFLSNNSNNYYIYDFNGYLSYCQVLFYLLQYFLKIYRKMRSAQAPHQRLGNYYEKNFLLYCFNEMFYSCFLWNCIYYNSNI